MFLAWLPEWQLWLTLVICINPRWDTIMVYSVPTGQVVPTSGQVVDPTCECSGVSTTDFYQLTGSVQLKLLNDSCRGPFKCYVTLFFLKLDPHPPPRNANNIEHYTFVTLFSRKSDTPHPHLRYVTLGWPLAQNYPYHEIHHY